MGEFNTIGSHLRTRQTLSAIHANAFKSGILEIRKATEQRMSHFNAESGSAFDAKSKSHVRAQGQALLNISDAKSMLTVVEDSLETIVEVLSEMKSLTEDAAEIQDGTAYDKARRNAREKDGWGGFWDWVNENFGGGDDEKKMSALRSAYKERLTSLSQEIDEIVKSTVHFGTPLLGDSRSSFTFFVDISDGGTIDVAIDPISAKVLSVAPKDIAVSSNERAGKTLESIESAISEVKSRLGRIVDVQDRLSMKYDTLKTSRSIHNAALLRIDDTAAARDQLERTKLQIIDQANAALLAQANTTSSSTMSLVDRLRHNDATEPLARIYTMDQENENGPVTPLRRIMLGHGSDRSSSLTGYADRRA